ncbi:hypothetical protein D6C77_06136 [Aureobasidium pullulans]|nr:hypothetical protein D6C77_06136 [Aureobasidium pullulans]
MSKGSAIKAGVYELYRLVEASCHESRAGEVSIKINGKQHNSMENDDEMHVKQSLLSPTALNKVPSATATRTKHQQKVKNPIMFGELPVVGDWREDKDTNKEEDKIFQQNNKVNVSNMSSAPSLPPAPRASMMASMPYEWLWCDNHVKITKWALTQPKLPYKQFYGSYLNYVNRLWEISRQKNHPALEGSKKSEVELLKKERMPADELLESLKEYWRSLGEGKSRWKENGLVVVDSQLDHQALVAAKNKLQAKVMKDLRKVENRLRAARLAAARNPVPATMANQQPLPAFVAPPAPASVPPLRLYVPPPPPVVDLPTPSGLELGSFSVDEQPLSLKSLKVIDDLGAAAGKRAQRFPPVAPVEFGELPLARGKKDEKKKGDEDEEDEIL